MSQLRLIQTHVCLDAVMLVVVRALRLGEYQAARILQPLAEAIPEPDPPAQYFMAMLYESGRGVVRDRDRWMVRGKMLDRSLHRRQSRGEVPAPEQHRSEGHQMPTDEQRMRQSEDYEEQIERGAGDYERKGDGHCQ